MSEVKRVKIDFSGLQGTVKCASCASTSTDICNQLGCRFLESGNGESEIGQLRQRAEEAEAELAKAKKSADTYLAAWEKCAEFRDVSEDKLKAAEQRITELVEWQAKAVSLLKEGQRLAKKDGSSLWEVVDDFLSALNQNSEGN